MLLHTLPLDGLRRSDTLRDPELRHYDSLALALRVLDVVMDRMGLEEEADREVVARALDPILDAMDDAAETAKLPNRHETIVDKVISALRNDSDARRPFREQYTALDEGGRAGRRSLEFRLLADTFHPSGRTVLRPSSEACNLYLRLLDLDIEDAQAAAEAVVESQLARGRFDEAIHSARQARIQSVRFQQKVLRILRDTRRDVDRVDWRDEVPRLLQQATDHLSRRLQVERGILSMADDHLDALPEENAADRQAVAGVVEQIRECRLRHVELHRELMRARNVFLEAQAHQSFVASPALPLPSLLDDVLEPVLAMPTKLAEKVGARGTPLLLGAAAPAVMSLSAVVTWMLQPRRPRPRSEVPVDPIDAATLEAELSNYPEEVRDQAAKILAELDGPTSLSTLLGRARTLGVEEATIELIALLALRGFASEDWASAGVCSELVPGSQISDPALLGDELLLVPWGGGNALAR